MLESVNGTCSINQCVSVDSVYCMEGPKGIISGEVYGRRSSGTNIIFRYFVDPVLQDISLVFQIGGHGSNLRKGRHGILNQHLHAMPKIFYVPIMNLPLLAAGEIAWLEWFLVDPSNLCPKK